MPTKVPEGAIGTARVKHIEVSEEESKFSRMRTIVTGSSYEYVEPGTFAQLLIGNTLMMSDTLMERRSNRDVVAKAKGSVLIAGLGLGMILWPILAKPEVKSVLVLEKNPDVIQLVGPHTPKDARLLIVEADVFTWPVPKTKFDTIYFDIWADISIDNLQEMTVLHRKFGRRKNPGGWMDSWQRHELLYRRRSERY